LQISLHIQNLQQKKPLTFLPGEKWVSGFKFSHGFCFTLQWQVIYRQNAPFDMFAVKFNTFAVKNFSPEN